MTEKRKPAAPGKGQTGYSSLDNANSNKPHKNSKGSLRKAINDKCRDCIYDDLAAGTWLQQVSLCNCPKCPLYDVRPKTKALIPDNVLRYYQVVKLDVSQGVKFNMGVQT